MGNPKGASKHGGRRKIGRAARKPSQGRYNALGRRETHKRRRILQSSGKDFLAAWEERLRGHPVINAASR